MHRLGESLWHVAPRAGLQTLAVKGAQLVILLHILLPGCRGENRRRLVALEVVNEEPLLGLWGEHRARHID